ncbi:MAG: hypothetical protein NT090_04795 [Acidobacteria bacterium]|nr:hypothetical protein [Acidobacteriota bacterium]
MHAFYCMLGISLWQCIHKKVQAVWPGLSTEQLIEQLREIQQFTPLCPPQGEKGPNRVAKVVSRPTLAQRSLADALGLERLL